MPAPKKGDRLRFRKEGTVYTVTSDPEPDEDYSWQFGIEWVSTEMRKTYRHFGVCREKTIEEDPNWSYADTPYERLVRKVIGEIDEGHVSTPANRE